MPTGDSPAKTLRPIAWTASGLLADRILWASDAPPHELVLLNPADGSIAPLRAGTHTQVAASPDGARIAMVSGNMAIGVPPTFAMSGARRCQRPGDQRCAGAAWLCAGFALVARWGRCCSTRYPRTMNTPSRRLSR